MLRTRYRLALALVLSLLFHLLPFVGERLRQQPSAARPPSLQASLRPLPQATAPLPEQAPLALTKEAPTSASHYVTAPKASGKPVPAKGWASEIRRQFARQQAQGNFYPAEAIAQGQEGEALVLMILDESGQVVAARIEQGSGFPLLDAAALRAVRALHSIPADAPRETVIPVRFRLR